jgi:hypothetical protein
VPRGNTARCVYRLHNRRYGWHSALYIFLERGCYRLSSIA